MLKINEMFIAAASNFTSQKTNQECYCLQTIHQDAFGNLAADTLFVSEEVFKKFSGSGIYTYTALAGGKRPVVVDLSKVRNLEL